MSAEHVHLSEKERKDGFNVWGSHVRSRRVYSIVICSILLVQPFSFSSSSLTDLSIGETVTCQNRKGVPAR
jgi:hypothetical protein